MDPHRMEPTIIGMIGDPAAHSLSPAFQQPAFDALGLPIRYELWHTPAAAFPERLERIRSGAALGANVTVPHKETAFRSVDHVSETAQRVGAVNTIVGRNGVLFGDNTDVHGFIVPLYERSVDLPRLHAVIVGAGGAARGVVVSLLSGGVHRVTIVNRTLHRAERIAEDLGDSRIEVAALASISEVIIGANLLVNATALGWDSDASPVSSDAMKRMADGGIAYDLTYRDTPFLAIARESGLETIDGLPMLVHQGARSFEIWTGQTAPIDLMWRSAVAARAARGG